MSEFTETVTDEAQTTVTLKPGSFVRDRWVVIRALGEGGCGSVYEVRHKTTGKIAALKVEKRQEDKEDEVLRMEVAVLKKLTTGSHVCHLYDFGKCADFNYMIITKVGHDLQQLRRACPQQHFTTFTAVRLTLQCLQGIRTLHDVGYVHRDIKPANFALGDEAADRQSVYLLDFGLARQYLILSRTGEKILREPRSDVGFRGTPRYCSVNVHRRLEQGRHDDLWSLFYMAIEMIRGHLPWKNKDKNTTRQLKADVSDRDLLKKCPQEFFLIIAHLKQLNYMTKPDYKMIQTHLQAILSRKNFSQQTAFDWEAGGRFYEIFKSKTDKDLKELESTADDEDDSKS